MTAYLFVLGRTPELAFLELEHVISSPQHINECVVRGLAEESPEVLMRGLGGTVKIAVYLETLDQMDPGKLASFLHAKHGERLVFGISTFGMPEHVSGTLSQVKNILESKGISSRYIQAKHGVELSSVVVAKQHVVELVIVEQNGKYVVGYTVAVQPFEAWNSRDYERPFADARAGMLPPKVARMIVNIARPPRQGSERPTLLDPFCGMGTIVAEALMSGWDVVGSDQKEDVVEKAKQNLTWLRTKNPDVAGNHRIFVCDAVHVSEALPANTIDAIVTEPFMGTTAIALSPAQVSREGIHNTMKGLEKLYIGCLKDSARILKSRANVVMALPRYTVGDKTFFVKKVVDSCERLGYTIAAGPIEYGRPQAVVKREFYIFQKNQ